MIIGVVVPAAHKRRFLLETRSQLCTCSFAGYILHVMMVILHDMTLNRL